MQNKFPNQQSYKLEYITEAPIVDLYIVYQFVRRLATPFQKTPAYKAGLIDDAGKLLKKRKEMTSAEKKHVTYFDLMIFNLKKLINKLPGGESLIKNYGVALFLLREEIETNQVDLRDVVLFAEEISKGKTMKTYKSFISEEGETATTGASSDSPSMSYTNSSYDMEDNVVQCSEFGRCKVFHVSDDTFNHVKGVKGRYDRFMKTVGKGPVSSAISDYAKSNPSKSIMLKNTEYGNYTMLKLGSKQVY